MILTESVCVHIRTWNSDRSKFHAWQKFMAEWTHWNSSFEFGDRDRAHRNAGNLGIWYLNENAETKIVATLLISIRFQRGLVRPLGPTGSWNRFFGQIGTWRRRPPVTWSLHVKLLDTLAWIRVHSFKKSSYTENLLYEVHVLVLVLKYSSTVVSRNLPRARVGHFFSNYRVLTRSSKYTIIYRWV